MTSCGHTTNNTAQIALDGVNYCSQCLIEAYKAINKKKEIDDRERVATSLGIVEQFAEMTVGAALKRVVIGQFSVPSGTIYSLSTTSVLTMSEQSRLTAFYNLFYESGEVASAYQTESSMRAILYIFGLTPEILTKYTLYKSRSSDKFKILPLTNPEINKIIARNNMLMVRDRDLSTSITRSNWWRKSKIDPEQIERIVALTTLPKKEYDIIMDALSKLTL
jgi:hypothetical protein